MSSDPAPLIVSALFGAADFAWLDGLRRAHFPAERNLLAAHLTLFHHLPPSVEREVRQRLVSLTRGVAPPPAWAAAVISLGRGVAIRIDSRELAAMRRELADAFAGLLTPQDAAGWRPHVTVQNKVTPAEAKTLQQHLEAGFGRRPVAIRGLALWSYRGGPWEEVSRHLFTS